MQSSGWNVVSGGTYFVCNSLDTGICAGVGYLYGTFFNLNKITAAKTFAVWRSMQIIFNLIVSEKTGGAKKSPKKFYLAHFIGGSIIGAINIIALYQLNLIGSEGAYFLSYIWSCIAYDNWIAFQQSQQVI